MGFWKSVKRFANHNLNPNNLLEGKGDGSYRTGMNVVKIAAAAPFVAAAAPYAVGAAKAGAAKLGGMFGGGMEGLAGGDIAAAEAAGSAGTAASAAGTAAGTGGSMSKWGKIGGFFKDHGGNIIDGLALAEGVYQNRRQNQIGDRYRALAEAEYAKRAPMRDKAMALMLDDTTPDTAAIFADPMAPQGRYRKLNVGSRG